MKVIAFIPARYQSTRFPGKPLALIMGKPMIQHVYERAASCPDLTDVCVATDDERILNRVVQFGGKALMTRKGHRSGTDRICEAALKSGLGQEDVVVNIQGDQPVFDPSVIPQMVEPILEDPSVAMSTLKCRIEREEEIRNPNCVKVVTDKEGFALYFSRHPIPFLREGSSRTLYFKHLGFYAYRVKFLVQFTRLAEGVLESAEKLEQLRALEYGFRIRVVETDHHPIDVDVPEDIEKVEAFIVG
jgi:3-deoxy-manno-octulosonate cytidylyltransferase (CMP-KDO synthetase)